MRLCNITFTLVRILIGDVGWTISASAIVTVVLQSMPGVVASTACPLSTSAVIVDAGSGDMVESVSKELPYNGGACIRRFGAYCAGLSLNFEHELCTSASGAGNYRSKVRETVLAPMTLLVDN